MSASQGSPRKAWKASAVKRSLREIEKKLDDLYVDLSDLRGRLPIPSPGEVRRIMLGVDPFTPEALLAGLLWTVNHTLRKISMRTSDLLLYTPRELRTSSRAVLLENFIRLGVVEGLENAAREAVQGTAATPEGTKERSASPWEKRT